MFETSTIIPFIVSFGIWGSLCIPIVGNKEPIAGLRFLFWFLGHVWRTFGWSNFARFSSSSRRVRWFLRFWNSLAVGCWREVVCWWRVILTVCVCIGIWKSCSSLQVVLRTSSVEIALCLWWCNVLAYNSRLLSLVCGRTEDFDYSKFCALRCCSTCGCWLSDRTGEQLSRNWHCSD